MAKTRTEVLSYAKSQQIEADGCFAITFIRQTGSNPVSISGYPLADGQAFNIQQNVGDIDVTVYDVVFTPTGGAALNDLYVLKIVPTE